MTMLVTWPWAATEAAPARVVRRVKVDEGILDTGFGLVVEGVFVWLG